jgi:plasmid stability protein
MSQLLVRNLDAEIVRRLKLRAGENGHSAEEEHRQILSQVLLAQSPPGIPPFKDYLISEPIDEIDIPLHDRRIETREPIDLSS